MVVALLLVGSIGALNPIGRSNDRVLLAAMTTAAFLGLFAYLSGNALTAAYLHLHFLHGIGEVMVICGALVGASFGFLWLTVE